MILLLNESDKNARQIYQKSYLNTMFYPNHILIQSELLAKTLIPFLKIPTLILFESNKDLFNLGLEST